MIDVVIEALLDSLKAFVFIFIVYIVLSFFENKIAKRLSKENKITPIYGSLIGLVPQCGISVVAADLYLKSHITMGTLLAVFISCSDEAIPLLIADGGDKALVVLPLLIAKFIIGFISGFLLDLVIKNKRVEEHTKQCNHEDIDVHKGCCNHEIEEENKWESHFIHPLLHSLKLFLYIFLINLLFGIVIYYLNENAIINFINDNKYFSPLLATLIGIIPNCASSVILTKLYLSGGLSFGGILSGLCVNAGLGLLFIFKDKSKIKSNLCILSILIIVSLSSGYLTCLINGF